MQHVIEDRAGNPVDVGGSVWRLHAAGHAPRIDWSTLSLPKPIKQAAIDYARYLIATHSSSSVVTFKSGLDALNVCKQCKLKSDGTLGAAFFPELIRLGLHEPGLWSIRCFYGWSAQTRRKGFSESAAREIFKIAMPHRRRGADYPGGSPDGRPLDEPEIRSIVGMLASRQGRDLNLRDSTAILLCLAFGSNAGQFALIRAEDYTPARSGAPAILRIPRHKKGLLPRADFREREIREPEIKRAIEQLIAANSAYARTIPWQEGKIGVPARVAIPLFMRDRPFGLHVDPNHPMHEWALHLSAGDFTAIVKKGILHLRPDLANVPPRRLRRTFTTYLLDHCHSAEAIADLLDHTSGPQYVLNVYAAGGPRVVAHVDAALKRGAYPGAIADFEKSLGGR